MKSIESTLTIFKEERIKRKAYESRLLRSYQHMAQRDHWCDNCCQHISPGECYEGRVYVRGDHKIVVFKYHKYPACDSPEDPKEERDYNASRLEQSASRVA